MAIFSDADSDSMHVSMADEAYRLPGVYPSETYLSGATIIDVALKAECDAVHPGYGFLSESAEFSDLCAKKGIKFIGPRAETLTISGNKLECKKLVESRGVPVIPYSREPLESWEEASRVASEIGYPVLLKSAFGGGGRGIKEARSRSDLKESFESSQREAASSFGRFAVFVEKKLVKPRHIEVQVLASEDSNEIIHLGERECSVQRRYQKLIEMSPSPIVDEKAREQITGYALKAAAAVRYSNAGTVEFLRDSATGNFYFIEINSRLQVEHPVTEAVTGVDLVSAQLAIASRGKLPLDQESVRFRGSAIECRINAEDPLAGFAPSTGSITHLRIPYGIGIRVDTALRSGAVVSPYYDSLLAKLVAHGEDRETARKRALVALGEFIILGVETTIPFHSEVLPDPAFVSGELDTGFIEERRIIEKLRTRRATTVPEDLAISAILLSINKGVQPRPRQSTQRRSVTGYQRESMRGRFTDAI